MPDLTKADAHFDFGANWQRFVDKMDVEALDEAERGLLKLIPANRLEGATFLDIGSGSGLHALAAKRLGARVTAIDIDKNSVEATRKLLGTGADVRQLSILESHGLGRFDIVYSWGVLHHTGAMWRAIDSAAALVKPGGLLVLALYQRTPFCGFWKVEKRLYTAAPRPARAVIRALYTAALLSRQALAGKDPFSYVKNYKAARGMDFFTDVHDWLGGYPYESVDPADLMEHVGKLGFTPVVEHALPKSIGVFGAGCCEFTLRREPWRAGSAVMARHRAQ